MIAPRWVLVVLGGVAILGIGMGVKRYQRAPVLPPISQATHYREQAERYLKAGQLTAAVIEYNHAVAEAPQDEQGYVGLALLYQSQGRADLAVEALEQLRINAPNAPHLCSRMAEAYLGVDDIPEAKRVALEATRCEPSNPLAFLTLGVALAQSEAWADAITALRKAQFLAPKDTDIGMTLMEVYLKKGDLEQGIRLGKEIAQNLPRSARLHYKLGWAYARQKQFDQALEALQLASQLAPEWFAPHAERGRIYRLQNRLKEAREAFETAARYNANIPGVLMHLHDLQKAEGDPQATQTAQRLARLQKGLEQWRRLRSTTPQAPRNPKEIMETAQADALAGRFAPALYRLKRFLRTDPTHLAAIRLYRLLDERARSLSSNYLRPSPSMIFPFEAL